MQDLPLYFFVYGVDGCLPRGVYWEQIKKLRIKQAQSLQAAKRQGVFYGTYSIIGK